MKILLVEPFFTGSHQQWAESLKTFSQHEVELLTLPGRHWKWRMHGGAVSLAGKFRALDEKPDLILVSDMLDLALFSSLIQEPSIPKAIYFHENQLTYPWSPGDPDPGLKRDNHYAFINYTSALVADRVFFNSAYHRNSFLGALTGFLQQFPDHREMENIQIIREKSAVLPLGMNFSQLAEAKEGFPENEVPMILWNHRWEYDKNPDVFFKTLFRLDEEGKDFQLVVLGESFGKKPAIFTEVKKRLKAKILHWGYAKNFSEYAQWLWKADILPVTAIQDFFGISVIQGVYCGCYPLLPKRLAYPEHFPEEIHPEIFYENEEELYFRLKELISDFPNWQKSFQHYVEHYDWSTCIQHYDRVLSTAAGFS
ncbi:MAG: DUF3524 domain-containing protein [Bacteroidetes bacterium]|nr:DUF3524 domain-containing protein [Bacteroidota bacterium]